MKPTKFRFTAPHDDAKNNYQPRATKLPKAASGVLSLAGSGTARAVGTPVWARPAAKGFAGSTQADVQVLDQALAERAGVSGVMVKVTPKGGKTGRVKVGVDYGSFAEAYGGNYGSRLQLVQLPTCALTTPEKPQCQTRTPLSSTNDAKAQAVSADVTLSAPSSASTLTATAADSVMVLAATAATASPSGTYTASDLMVSGSWAGGVSTGSFSYSYPITLPASPGSLVPAVNLSYDSSGVDGQTASTQAQASWVGDGWGTPHSYIEQSFVSCSDDPEGTASPSKTSDLCYDGLIMTMSLDGTSTSLVYDKDKSTTAKDVFRAESEHGEVIEHVYDKTARYDAGYWKVTTRDGTVYKFGLNKLPGWATGKDTTNSVDTVPVYGSHAGNPCYSTAGFASSYCTMARRWNLDYVTDVYSNAMSYYYKQDSNYYGRNQGKTMDTYVRDSHLDHIDYGFRDGGAYGTVPNKVEFTIGDRCLSGTCQPLNATTKANWPDVPFDLICASGTTCKAQGPSYFSTVRLTTITTKQYTSGSYQPVDSYALQQTMPDTGDGTSPTLWLSSITRTASDKTSGSSTAITMPPVSFAGVRKPNRVAVSSGFPAYNRQRMQSVTTETGSVITADYDLPNPCTSTSGLDPATNTKSCFPVRWTPAGLSAPILDWFNKYAVTRVTATDPTGGAPAAATSYQYLGGAAWRYDDNELVKAKYRTYGQFRGYKTVRTFTGDGVSDRRTKTETTYYRGMSKNNNSTVVNVTDSLDGVHEDVNELAGSVLETTTYQGEGGPVDSSTITAYWVSGATATRARTGLPAMTANWVAPALKLTRQRVTGSGTPKWRDQQTDNSYDTNVNSATFGVLKASYGHTVPADAKYDRCTTNTYAPTGTSSPLVGLVSQTETVAVACGGFTQGNPASEPATLNTLTAPANVSRPSQVVSQTRTFYDDTKWDTTFPQTTVPTKGAITMTQVAKDYVNSAYTYLTTKKASYDSYGREERTYDGNGNLTKTEYTDNTVGLTTGTKVANALGQYASTSYSPTRGLALSGTDINGVVTSQRYDALGRSTGVWLNSRPATSPANYKFSYKLNNTGITATTTEKANDAGGYIRSVTLYDAILRVRQTQTNTPQGGRMVSDNFYDSRGWITSSYNGWWDSKTSPTVGAPVSAANLGAKVPNQTLTTYDGLGRAIVVESAKDNVKISKTTAVYQGDRTTVIPPVGSTVTTTVTDPAGRTSNLIEYKVRPTVTAPTDTFTGEYTITPPAAADLITTTYGYNARGDQNTVTDTKNNTWTTDYNLLGQVKSKTDPDAGTTTGMTYDANGNLLQSTDARGKTISTTYDALSRPTGTYAAASDAQTSANQLTKMVYDNADNAIEDMEYPEGRLTTATSYAGGQAYKLQALGFTVFGSSIGETLTIPAAEGALAGDYTVDHDYTISNGLLLRDIYSAKHDLAEETLVHQYDAFDNPVTLSGLDGYVQGVTRDAYGRVNYQTIGAAPNLANLTNTYDEHTGELTKQLVTRTPTTPADVDQQEYQYDLTGNLVRQTSTRLAAGSIGETQCFNYDELRRLTQAWTATDSCTATPTTADHTTVGNTIGAASAYWTSWTFDDLGNRTSQVQHALSGSQDTTTDYTYTGKPHQVMSTTTSGADTGNSSYTYDASGNTQTRNPGDGEQTLTWDQGNRLTGVTTSNGNSSNIYGPDGALLLQKDPGTTTLYLGSQQFALNTSTNTVTGTRYYALPGGGSAIRTASGCSFALADPRGSPTLYLNNTAQTPTWRMYTPYGDNRGASINIPDNRGFLNKTVNNSIGLVHLGAREYDTTIGRFISVDPIQDLADPQQWNGYAYANNNPVTLTDPDGLEPRPWHDPNYNPDTCKISSSAECHPGGGGSSSGGGGSNSKSDKNDGSKGGGKGGRKSFWGAVGSDAWNFVIGGVEQTSTIASCIGWIPGTGVLLNGWSGCKALGQMALDMGTQAVKDGFNSQLCFHGIISSCQSFADDHGCEKLDAECAGHGFFAAAAVAITHKTPMLRAAPEAAAAESAGARSILDDIAAAAERGCKTAKKNSFTPGTLVLMADGSLKPIEDIQVGDMVLAADPETGEQTAEAVTVLHVNNDTDFVDLSIETGDGELVTLHTTEEHPFWSASRRTWVEAGDLQPSEALQSSDAGSHPEVASVRSFRGAKVMYNLTVADLHTYYVLVGSTPVLVHNCGDLVGDDAEFPGAHVLDEHVNVTPERAVELAGIKGGRNSVFIDGQTAQQVVDYALAGNKRKIQTWLRGSDQQISLRGRFGAPNSIGTVFRADGSSAPTGNGYYILLQRARGHSGGYYVHTAYPE
ncbi:polymorphic toxin-type HINT domain-containing protein [Actinoplanes regularis]|uniref:polymorphic toxin-type HINT domain-containing protein n=1 Tax=Actinoplanes regularis TaxID=52697 RepID=UPI002553C521|nr:polymorphic toxin-type HINT domain-containing protein [Actinoplanes regularis]